MKSKHRRETIFHYKKPTEEVIEEINKLYPIKLNKLQELIDRVSLRYPLIPKPDVAFFIMKIFELFRQAILTGAVISFNNLFRDFHFRVYKDRNGLNSMRFKFFNAAKLKKS